VEGLFINDNMSVHTVPVVGATARKSGWRFLPEISATRFSVSGSLRPKLGLLLLLVILIVSTALILVPFVTSRLSPPGQSSPPPHLALKLHKFLSSEINHEEHENFVSSSALASLSLISLVAATGGQTRSQLKQLLASGDSGVGIDKFPNVTLGVYNQLYVDKRWATDANQGIIKEDFSRPNQARANINNRLKKSSARNMVEMDLSGLGENIDMVVISALDFKAKFRGGRGKSELETFHFSPDVSVQVPMWTHFGVAKSVAGLDSLALVLPLDSGISLVVILADEKEKLGQIEHQLEYISLKSLIKSSGDEVNIKMPGFSAETELDLTKFFKAQGVTEVFDETRIETNIFKSNGLALNKVIHKVKVNVTDNGGETTLASLRMRGKLKTVTCNHPFIFLIVDKTSEVVLFVGRVVNPARK